MSHAKTWLLWINELSPISPKIANVSLQDREQLAQALALAAPGGPVGVACVDDCRCQAGLPAASAALLLGELCDRGIRVPDQEKFLSNITNSLRVDLVSPSVFKVPPVAALADINVIVSDRNALVAHARGEFKRTWELLRAFVER